MKESSIPSLVVVMCFQVVAHVRRGVGYIVNLLWRLTNTYIGQETLAAPYVRVLSQAFFVSFLGLFFTGIVGLWYQLYAL